MLYAYELDCRLRTKGSSIQSIAFDPSLIVETSLYRSAPAIMQLDAAYAAIDGNV
nr:hypothetical protein [uncultured Acetobacter sp.]